MKIASHKSNFIFIHVPKTGGVSICRALGIPIKGHTPITDYKEKHFSFAFVRNPWDRLVSSFFFLNKGGINKYDEQDRDTHISKYKGNFKHFVKGALGNEKKSVFKQQHFRPQFTWVCDEKGNLAVDFIGKFENMQEDFNKVCNRTGIRKRKLPYSNRTRHKHYSKYYDEETKQIVAETFKKDIEYFGYKFESPSFFERAKCNINYYLGSIFFWRIDYWELAHRLSSKLKEHSKSYSRLIDLVKRKKYSKNPKSKI